MKTSNVVLEWTFPFICVTSLNYVKAKSLIGYKLVIQSLELPDVLYAPFAPSSYALSPPRPWLSAGYYYAWENYDDAKNVLEWFTICYPKVNWRIWKTAHCGLCEFGVEKLSVDGELKSLSAIRSMQMQLLERVENRSSRRG